MADRIVQSLAMKACQVAWLLLACSLSATGVLAADAPAALAPGEAREARLEPGQQHRYHVQLAAGQAVELSLQQRDAMLQLRWSGPDGRASPPLSSQAGREARLHVFLLAESARAWTITINAAKPDRAAAYHLQLGPAHAISPRDRVAERAGRRFAAAEAIRLAAGGVEPGRHAADLDAARAGYRHAIEDWHALGERCDVLTAAVGLARFELAQARYPQAQAAAQNGLDAGCGESDDPAVAADRAAALRTLAAALGYQGDFEASAAASETALALYRRTGDRRFQGVVLGNLSAVYRSLGETRKALAAAHSALDIAEATGDAQGVVFSRENIADAHLARGELATALAIYRRTLDDLRATPYPMAEGLVWNELGTLYRRFGDTDEARAAWAKARAIWEATGNRSGMAETWISEGESALDEDATARAAAAFTRALDIAHTDHLQSPKAHALRGLGQVATTLGNYDEAARQLDASLALARTIGEWPAQMEAERALGDLDARRARAPAARRHYQRALDLARRIPDRAGEAAASASLARLDLHSGRLAQARDAIEHALAIVETERAAIAEPDLRTGYFASRRAYHDLHVDVLMQLDARAGVHPHADLALAAAERARARALQDLLGERGTALERSVDADLLAAERDAEDALHRLAYRLARLPVATDIAARVALQHDIDAASRRLDEARGRIRSANPRYAELAQPPLLKLAEMQAWLDDGASVLEYWLGESRSYLWLVTRTELRVRELPPRAAIERDLRALRDALLAPGRPQVGSFEQLAATEASASDATEAAATALAAQVLPADLRARLGADVVVVADGGLQDIPFAVLDATPSRRYTYLPALGALRGLRAIARDPAPRRIALFADPVFAASDPRLHGAAKAVSPDAAVAQATGEVGIGELARLAYTREEAQAIAALAPAGTARLALDFDASRSEVADFDWKGYAVAHFATHALLNARHPELSGIVMSLYDAHGHAEDGFLRMNDIYQLDMPVDLVVLGVCDSALGASPGSEGAFSLARAFFYAGARRVVASLWPVDDRASAALMTRFHRGLLERGETPAQALVAAQHDLRMDPRWRAPYYWAGFVLQGDWQ